jgi:uncharacterized membrane protein YgaE (UPF0421/DUF939 family)
LPSSLDDKTGAIRAIYELLLHYFIILEGVSVAIAAPLLVGLEMEDVTAGVPSIVIFLRTIAEPPHIVFCTGALSFALP